MKKKHIFFEKWLSSLNMSFAKWLSSLSPKATYNQSKTRFYLLHQQNYFSNLFFWILIVQMKAFYKKLLWHFTVWMNRSSDLKTFANSWPSASNFKSEQYFLIVGKNNLGNKIQMFFWWFSGDICLKCTVGWDIKIWYVNVKEEWLVACISQFDLSVVQSDKLYCKTLFRSNPCCTGTFIKYVESLINQSTLFTWKVLEHFLIQAILYLPVHILTSEMNP